MQKKTSIDGLAVRASGRRSVGSADTSKKMNTRANGRRTPRQAMDVKPQRRRMRTMNDMVPQKNRDLGVLQPVEEVEFGEALENTVVTDDGWSEALGAIDETEQVDELEVAEELVDGGDEEMADEVEEEEPKKDRKTRKAEKRAAKKAKKATQKHRKLKLVLKIIGGLIVVALVVFLIWGDWLISRLTAGNSGIFDAFMALVSEGEPFKTDEHGRTNVLVFGTEGFDMEGSSFDGEKHDGAQLTDSIMIISFDQETKDVALISLPRDLKVRAACSAGKVNEVFWCNNQDGNNEEAGAKALMEQVGEIFGLDFQYYVHVNWGSVVEIVDTLGGITVTLDEDVNDVNYTGTVIRAGEPTQLSGAEAVGLARARHGTTGGDFTRGNSQQKIVEGIVQKVIDNGIGVAEAFNLVNILGDNLRMNFSMENIRYGMNFVKEFDMNNIRQVPLVDYENNIYYVKTATIGGVSYVIPQEGEGRYTQIQAYVDQMLSSDPAVREGAQIAVFNATGAQGLAGTEQERLEADGFRVTLIGDAATGSCEAKYCVYIMNEEMSLTREAMASRYDTEVRGREELPGGITPRTADIVIVIGQTDTPTGE